MSFWDRVEQLRAENDVLTHPFYVRWSAGELAPAELARYGAEYRHAVLALAGASANAAGAAEPALRDELEAHAREEQAHIELWDGFARAVGSDLSVEPLPETRECAAVWTGEERPGLTAQLVALYAIESAQPAISATKLQGLREHYGIAGGAGTAYFELHMERDVEHARHGRELIESRLEGADEEALLAEAEAVLKANWKLLDGVERLSRA